MMLMLIFRRCHLLIALIDFAAEIRLSPFAISMIFITPCNVRACHYFDFHAITPLLSLPPLLMLIAPPMPRLMIFIDFSSLPLAAAISSSSSSMLISLLIIFLFC